MSDLAQRVADALGYEFASDGQSVIRQLAEAGLAIETAPLEERRTDAIDGLRERFDSLIAHVRTWGNAGDGFVETLEDVRAALRDEGETE